MTPKPGDLIHLQTGNVLPAGDASAAGPEVGFLVGGIRRQYVPFSGGVVRIIPNEPQAIASARRSLAWSMASWLN